MKVAILAGGKGERLSEKTAFRPKALVEIGDHPILWHLISYFAQFGFDDFVIATGAQREKIDQYFVSKGEGTQSGAKDSRAKVVDWDDGQIKCRIMLVDTGAETATGGRIKRLAPYLRDETFILTWCDGLADIDVNALVGFHQRHECLATLTAVRPPPRFGRLALDRDDVAAFCEKAPLADDWVSGAFFVLEPTVLDRISGDETSFEYDVLPRLARDRQLKAYRHESFWACMDTIHDHQALESLWRSGEAPWKFEGTGQ